MSRQRFRWQRRAGGHARPAGRRTLDVVGVYDLGVEEGRRRADEERWESLLTGAIPAEERYTTDCEPLRECVAREYDIKVGEAAIAEETEFYQIVAPLWFEFDGVPVPEDDEGDRPAPGPQAEDVHTIDAGPEHPGEDR